MKDDFSNEIQNHFYFWIGVGQLKSWNIILVWSETKSRAVFLKMIKPEEVWSIKNPCLEPCLFLVVSQFLEFSISYHHK